jgi:hypothetical protein
MAGPGPKSAPGVSFSRSGASRMCWSRLSRGDNPACVERPWSLSVALWRCRCAAGRAAAWGGSPAGLTPPHAHDVGREVGVVLVNGPRPVQLDAATLPVAVLGRDEVVRPDPGDRNDFDDFLRGEKPGKPEAKPSQSRNSRLPPECRFPSRLLRPPPRNTHPRPSRPRRIQSGGGPPQSTCPLDCGSPLPQSTPHGNYSFQPER